LNILHLSPFYCPASGGAELHVKAVSERLVARGHQVSVLTTRFESDQHLERDLEGALPELEVINSVHVVRLPSTSDLTVRLLNRCLHVRGGYRVLNYLFSPSGLEMLLAKPRNLQFARWIRRSNADIVVSWNWHFPLAYHAYLARLLKPFKLIGVPLFHTAENWALRPVYDRMIAACDGFSVNTSHEKEFILNHSLAPKIVKVAGVGIDPLLFARRDGRAFRARHGLDRYPLVGYVGRLFENKRAHMVIEAMRLVWRRHKDARVVLAGRSYDKYPELEKILRALSPEERNRVLILNNFADDEKASLYEALDVFVLPSIGESFGIAYLEAWMCRKPVIGSRIGSTACVIEDGIDGLLVDPDDSKTIADAIIQLLADPERRVRMGERGYAKTVAHFTWDRVTDEIENLYVQMTGESSLEQATRSVIHARSS
jgi:glycosyltransferase involved in cell wall biosynthesis